VIIQIYINYLLNADVLHHMLNLVNTTNAKNVENDISYKTVREHFLKVKQYLINKISYPMLQISF